MSIDLKIYKSYFSDCDAEKMSRQEKCKYMQNNINNLTKNQKINFGLIVKHEMPNLLEECAEGILINLQVIPDKLLDNLYSFIEFSLNN